MIEWQYSQLKVSNVGTVRQALSCMEIAVLALWRRYRNIVTLSAIAKFSSRGNRHSEGGFCYKVDLVSGGSRRNKPHLRESICAYKGAKYKRHLLRVQMW